MNIVEFLRARLDEDEAVARAAIIPAHDAPDAYQPHPELAEWRYDGHEVEYVQTPEMLAHKYYVTMDNEGLLPSVDDDVAPHIARHDPARVLREVEAKRRMIVVAGDVAAQIDGEWGCCHDAAQILSGEFPNCYYGHDAVVQVLAPLAAVYADHPDYDPEWV